MPQEACKLCGQTNKTFKHTLNDKLITQFLLNAVVRLDSSNKNQNVCSICYAKAKIVVDFVTAVNRAQNQSQTSSSSNIVITSVHDSQSSTTNFVAIKQEHVDSPDIFYNEFEDDSNLYEDDNQSEPEVESKTTKRKYKWPKIKHGSGIRVKRAEPQNNAFKCANCKQEHKNFKALEAHIADCFKAVEEFKCFVCDKVLETKKKLYSHMESHKVYNKRVRDRSGPPQKEPEAKAIKFKCNQCTSSFNLYSDLTKHKREKHNEETVKRKTRSDDKDMSEVLLEKARRLIDEIN